MSPQQIAMAASVLRTTPGDLQRVLVRGMKPETSEVNKALLEALKGLLKASGDVCKRWRRSDGPLAEAGDVARAAIAKAGVV